MEAQLKTVRKGTIVEGKDRGEAGKRYLSGVVWQVYLYVLTSSEPVGVRDVWRGLKLSSPSLAQYHINRLLKMGLIAQTVDGRYAPEEKARIDVLRSFVLLRGRLISRMTIYGAFILGLFSVYLFVWPFNWDFQDLTVLVTCVFSTAAFFFEAYSQHRGLRTGVQRF
ncbi:MAG: hypothetical protein QW057_09335 [Candidatus Bathyarchaeia archaeon]